MTHHPPTARRRATAALVGLLGLFGTLLPLAVTAAPAGAEGNAIATADFSGRGWGHGRGMSQYGAFGYARDFGWSTEQILAHYYGGTKAGQASTAGGVTISPDAVRIRLIGLDGEPGTLVGTGSGSSLLLAGAEPLDPLPPEAKAVRMLRSGDHWNVDWAASCGGPWKVLGATTGGTITVSRKTGTDDLYTCNPDGTRRHYAGSIRATITDVGTRTINITTIEEYLRGVVPNEMPPSWHANALAAQAVAARSYAMAGDTRHKDSAGVRYADTCDTTLCQVYKGRFTQASPTAAKVASTAPSTDAAIAATAGQVRVFTSSGTIARTEFSSTSGGWTAGGTFPAVEDEGDAISPLHTWGPPSRFDNVSLAPLASLGTGDLLGIRVTERNGLGADGGRVLEVELDFSGQSAPVTASGNTIRSKLGLLSDWFSISDIREQPPKSGFTDVPDSSVFSEAVAWAAGGGITTGCTETLFCPSADVTRAQAATFLWRQAGKPAGSGAQFDDVEDGTYYFDAVRWVRDRGITKGCTETEFCPNGTATRAQLVTFLWRHAGEPASNGGNSFSDVPEGAYYEEAVDWAVEQGITTGTSASTFSPNDNVSRGQTVLFLFRYLGDA